MYNISNYKHRETDMNNYEQGMSNIKTYIEKASIKQQKKEKKDLKNNVFTILKIEDAEIRHSNFLAYLMENNKKFLMGVLQHKNMCNIDKDTATKMLESSIKVDREHKKDMNNRSVDIVVNFKDYKILIVIENKIYSGEGENQLQDYYSSIQESKDYVGYKKYFFYLTINGISPEHEYDRKNWTPISYGQILDILSTIQRSVKNKSIQDILIDNYIDVLRDKTEVVMDRVKDYYELYKNNKELMLEMCEYMPQINQRAKIERDYINAMPTLSLKSERANAFVVYTHKDISAHLVNNGLSGNAIEFGIANEPYYVMGFYITVDSVHKDFISDFRKQFDRIDNSKSDSSYKVIYSCNLVISNKKQGYLTEAEFQSKIQSSMKEFFEDESSEYHKIVDFILNYKFK